MTTIYKIVPRSLWAETEKSAVFEGAPIDHADGFIHFSTAEQLAQTAALHFAGQDDLLLVAVDGDHLGEALKFESSRGGDLFPHLYGKLTLDDVMWVRPMPLDPAGDHILPDLAP